MQGKNGEQVNSAMGDIKVYLDGDDTPEGMVPLLTAKCGFRSFRGFFKGPDRLPSRKFHLKRLSGRGGKGDWVLYSPTILLLTSVIYSGYGLLPDLLHGLRSTLALMPPRGSHGDKEVAGEKIGE